MLGVGALFTQGCDGLRAGSTGRTRSPPAQPAWTDTLIPLRVAPAAWQGTELAPYAPRTGKRGAVPRCVCADWGCARGSHRGQSGWEAVTEKQIHFSSAFY